MKILIISEQNNLLESANQHYAKYISSDYMKFFTPKDMELETHYDAIIAEEGYLNIINIKSVPVIIIQESEKSSETAKKLQETEFQNFIFIQKPINWDSLYEIITSLQYVHNNIDFSSYHKPKVKNLIEDHSDNDEDVNVNQRENNEDNSINNESLAHELSTKLYNEEDLQKLTNLMQSFGEEHNLNDKIIAQASIILDELVFALQKFQDATMSAEEPKIIMKLEAKDSNFNLFLECRRQLPNFKQVISIARDYGSIVKSFERNNSYFLNVQWDKE